ncbi:MAG: C40 family peptidase [Robiginitomaculum sp.]|nr:C40 family peptidase [Robiginitomaculum sp.]
MLKTISRHDVSRRAIIDETLSWVGTPYQHQCSTKHAGCDCLGLVRGIWRKLYGSEPAKMPPYTPDWAEIGEGEILKSACDHHLDPISLQDARPADILLFRMQAGVQAKHMAVLVEPDLIVHAYWGRSVTRSFLAPFWQSRCAYAYSFPNLSS